MDEKKNQGNAMKNEQADAFKTHLIPDQAKQPVAPVASTSPYRTRHDSEDLFSDYSIRGKIGSGGMGTVYVALDKRLKRFVAIKRLKSELLGEVAVRRRFLHEARAAAALNNVHIVHIYSIGEDSGGPYIVMEYVESALPKTDPNGPCPPQTLEQFVSRVEPFKLDDGITFMLKVGHAIEVAHAGGVIHRDLKPSNVLLDSVGEPKIVDFGLARLTRADSVTALTATGDKFLSLGYAAPEQETDATLTDERADVYGLGALLFFILTGKNPRFFREEILPASVRPIVCKALATDRDARYQTVASFNAALTALLVESKTEHPTVKTTWRCKWCDTINPLSTRFCGECGWDGREQCPECGEDQQFGTSFCGVCGANAREYENVSTVLRKERAAIASRHYEWAVNYASQPMTFEPVGPNGRQMLEEIQSLSALARQRYQRREQLRAVIPTEISSENYERAQRFIQEFRDLSPAQDAFAEELHQLPAHIQKRDLLRVQKAFASQDWDLGERLLQSMSGGDAHDDLGRRSLLRQLNRRKRRVASLRLVVGLVVVVFVYLLLMPIFMRLNVPGSHVLCRPARMFLRIPRVGVIAEHYAALWGNEKLDIYLAEEERRGVFPVSLLTSRTPSPELNGLRSDYERELRALKAELSSVEREWGEAYMTALVDLRQHHREAGDYEAWKRADQELVRFSEKRLLPVNSTAVHASLQSLQATFAAFRDERRATVFRKHVDLTHRLLNELNSRMRELTRNDKMGEAEQFNDAVKSIQSAPEYLHAEAQLAVYASGED